MSNWLINNEGPYSQVMGSDQWAGKQSQVPLSPTILNHTTSIPTIMGNAFVMGNTTMPTGQRAFTVSPLATSAPIKMSPNPFMTTITSSAGVYTPAPLGTQNPVNVRPTPTSARVEAKTFTPGITNKVTPVPSSNTTKNVSEHFSANNLTPVPIKAAYTINNNNISKSHKTPPPILPNDLGQRTEGLHIGGEAPLIQRNQQVTKSPNDLGPVSYVISSPTLSSTPY